MAFNIIAVGFEQYPSDSLEDILKYSAFDPVTAGKLLWGEVVKYRQDLPIAGANLLIFRILEKDIISPNVPIVFTDSLADGGESGASLVPERIDQMLSVVQQIRDIIEFEETPNDIFSSLGDGMVGSVLLGAAPLLETILVDSQRSRFKLIEGM